MTQSPPQAGSPAPRESHGLEERSAEFVNPVTGLANDYLNLFNEIVMVIEQLPEMPELMPDLLAWRPTSYREYFERSSLAGRRAAQDAYGQLDQRILQEFEAIVSELDRLATGAVASIRRHYKVKGETDPDGLVQLCERFGANLRLSLQRATNIVNHGVAETNEMAQQRADRMFAIRRHAMKQTTERNVRSRREAGGL